MLNNEPEIASRYSSMIIQDIINSHSREVAELTEHFIKRIIKFSTPLAGLVIIIISINYLNLEPFLNLVVKLNLMRFILKNIS